MHPEELCRIIQANENNDADEMEYEREMTSHEYLDMYFPDEDVYYNDVNE